MPRLLHNKRAYALILQTATRFRNRLPNTPRIARELNSRPFTKIQQIVQRFDSVAFAGSPLEYLQRPLGVGVYCDLNH
jgi:hypothetical protein